MKYLKKFNEQKSSLYEIITWSMYRELVGSVRVNGTHKWINIIPIRTIDYNQLVDAVGDKLQIDNYDRYINLSSIETDIDITIRQVKDEYFLLTKLYQDHDVAHYKCDQIDGVIEYLKNEIFDNNDLHNIHENVNESIEDNNLYYKIDRLEYNRLYSSCSDLTKRNLKMFRKMIPNGWISNSDSPIEDIRNAFGRIRFTMWKVPIHQEDFSQRFLASQMEDEWLLVMYMSDQGSQYYKCDSFDGFESLTKDIIL